jgi:hypothetical protein
VRLQEILKGEPAKQLAEMFPPFGPGFARQTIEQLDALQIHCSDFQDSGPDFCEFRALDVWGELIGTRRIKGY